MLWSLLKRVTVFVAVLLVAICILLVACQRSLIYYPRNYHASVLERAGKWSETVTFTTSQGRQHAYLVRAEDAPRSVAPGTLWLVTSGNAALALDWLEFATRFTTRHSDHAFLLIDYPGYGASEGKACPESIREAARGAVEAAAERWGENTEALQPRLAALGQSIGAAAALEAADRMDIRRVVLISPFTSMTDMARRMVGSPLCYLCTHRFDNIARIRSIADKGARIIILHGDEDTIIPPEMSEQLRAERPDAIDRRVIRGAGHNDIILLAEDELVRAMEAVRLAATTH